MICDPLETAPPSVETHATTSAVVGAWFLLGIVVVTMALPLAGRPLAEPDEGRNAEVAREMAASGDLLIPRYDGLPLLDKPFLWFAASAVSMRALGSQELATRLPSFVCTLLTAAFVAWLAGRWWGRRTRELAALALLASPIVAAYANLAIFDSMLTLFVTVALGCFQVAVETARTGVAGSARRWTLCAWLACGLAVLTKGPIGLVVPLLVAVPYAVHRKRPRAVLSLSGASVLALTVFPWLLHVARLVPDYADYVWRVETLSRLGGHELGYSGSPWLLAPVLFFGAFPWSVVVAVGVLEAALSREEGDPAPGPSPEILFLGLWIVLPLVLFFFAQPQRPQYVLPAIPGVALLAARFLRRGSGREGRGLPIGRALGACWLGLGAILLGAWANVGGVLSRVDPAVREPAHDLGLAFGLVALAAGAVSWWADNRRLPAALAASVPVILFPVLALPLAGAISETHSSRDLARALETAAPGAQVVAVDTLPTSLPFYLRETVAMTSADGGRFPSTYISRSWERWRSLEPGIVPPSSAWRQPCAPAWADHSFVIQRSFAPARFAMESAGRPLVFEGTRYAAFGPCPRPGAGSPERSERR